MRAYGIHLHVHSGYSFLDGASSVQDLVSEAVRYEMPALALTDHHGLYGAVRFVQSACQQGIQPILGAEITLEDSSHLTLLCETERGYSNLCQLLTRAHIESPRGEPRVRLEWLPDYAEGLIALTGCRLGRFTYLLRAGRYEQARQWLVALRNIFGKDHLFVELQHTYKPGDTWIVNRQVEAAQHLGVPVVATGNVHYARAESFAIHDLLTCARLGVTLTEAHPRRPINDCNSIGIAQRWKALYHKYPEAWRNSLEIAQRCTQRPLVLGRNLFPRFPLGRGEDPASVLMALVRQGARRRYAAITASLRSRLRRELRVICELGYADYFLAVHDLIQFAQQQRIRYSARGSVSDSAVAYALGISDVDPVRRGLPFERFLSFERSQKPDIDLDFDAERREEIFHYVRRRYGEEHVAMVGTFSTYRARSAVRLVGKVLGLPAELVDRLAKRIPPFCYADDIERAFASAPELRESGFTTAQLHLLLRLAEQIANLPHHLGTHLGGIIISRDPVSTIVPVQMSPMNRRVVQWDKDDVEEAGFIKLDLLSLRMLSAVQRTEEQIRLRLPDFRVCNVPYDDPATFQMIQEGETIGAFQIESPAQRALHTQLNSQSQMDIDISVALIRPGPIRGDMVSPFVARRNGEEPITYLHPDIEPILRHTCGVPVFQEQIILIACRMAGFTPGEADQLRKTMTHNRSRQEMEKLGNLFVQRAVQRGYHPRLAMRVYEWIYGFAGYGFPEAHAASFGDTAYKTAYLLRHYPAEFYAGLLSSQPMGYYSPNTLALQARRRGIRILLPDVNRSEVHCTVEEGNIRLGWCRVKGMSRDEMESLLEARSRGPFYSLDDLCCRTNLRRDTLERLVLCGAFDGWDANRRQWLMELHRALARRQAAGSLFHTDELYQPLEEVEDFTPWEKFLFEWDILGLSVDCHIMSYLRDSLRREGILSSADLPSLPDGRKVRVAGLVVSPHRPPTRSGRKVLFFSLEDEFGLVDAVMFENTYQAFGHWVITQPIVVVEGVLRRRGRGISLIAHNARAYARSEHSKSSQPVHAFPTVNV